MQISFKKRISLEHIKKVEVTKSLDYEDSEPSFKNKFLPIQT